MKQTHTHTKSKKREKKRESVLILTENKEPKNERDFTSPNFALSHKKNLKKNNLYKKKTLVEISKKVYELYFEYK